MATSRGSNTQKWQSYLISLNRLFQPPSVLDYPLCAMIRCMGLNPLFHSLRPKPIVCSVLIIYLLLIKGIIVALGFSLELIKLRVINWTFKFIEY